MKKIKGKDFIDNVDGIVKQVAESIEEEVGVSIFTMRPLNHNKNDRNIKLIIVFEDKTVMEAFITVEIKEEDEDLAVRVRGNFI